MDVSASSRPALTEFFAPYTVAVIGASEAEGTVGRTVMQNLATYKGAVYPVNPKRTEVLGKKAYASIGAVPEPIDLAVIVTPAETVPGVVRECAAAKVPAAIVISAGFKEAGARGVQLEQEILAARGKMRVLGPNCIGLMAPLSGLNATFAGNPAPSGSIGFLSQSGALCTSILDWSIREKVGFSAFVSTGSMLDVGWGDLISYLGEDRRTSAILMYMESVGDARSFLSAAREVALTKPIIVIKAGRSEQAARAAASHTGALTGSDEVLDAALRRSGVLRVNRISDLFYMADTLAKQPRPSGPRLLIVTNAGGPGVLATDALMMGGGELAELSAATIAELDAILPSHWSHQNPIDIFGDAPVKLYSQTMAIAAKDPNVDGILMTFSPQGITDPARVAEQLKPFAKIPGKPMLASWLGGATVEAGRAVLNASGIPSFPFPDTAARAFTYMWQYSSNLRALYETPEPVATQSDRAVAEAILATAKVAEQTLLPEAESKRLLAAYGIPTVRTEVADAEDEAVRLAAEVGYPVALKLRSLTISHKTDVGGVQLNLRNEASVRAAWKLIEAGAAAHAGPGHFQGVTVQPMVDTREAYELILGSSVDAQFGPVLLFGSGGQLVEVLRDRALGLPPLNSTLARRLMEQTKIYQALRGVRGRKPVDLPLLEQILVRFSQLVAEQPRIREIDINPLVASAAGIVALDARIVLHEWSLSDAQLPHPAIRPYPSEYVTTGAMRDGSTLTLRPIRPEDEPAMVHFHESLSERSVYLRYFHHLSLSERVSHERLTRICFGDYDRQMVLVAENGIGQIVGVGRLNREPGGAEAEFALLVGDPWQHSEIGTELLTHLLRIGRGERIPRIYGYILEQNRAMQEICRKLGFHVKYVPGEAAFEASIES